MSETETIARNLSGELARHRKTQAALARELDALKSPALADMDLDRIRDIKRDCSTCINLLDQLGRERR